MQTLKKQNFLPPSLEEVQPAYRKIIYWNKVHCLGMTMLFFFFIFTGQISVLIGFSAISFGWLWIRLWTEISHFKPAGGLANRITLIRNLGLICLISFQSSLTNLQITLALTFLIILDGLDGYLARKKNQITLFGNYFDKETDAMYVCLVSCVLFLRGSVGSWILLPAFVRYFFVTLVVLAGLYDLPEKANPFGATVAVFMFLALAFAFVLPENFRLILMAMATFLVMLSFGYSFVVLLKQKPGKMKIIVKSNFLKR